MDVLSKHHTVLSHTKFSEDTAFLFTKKKNQILPSYKCLKRAGKPQSIQQLVMGWTVRGSNPSGGRDFLHPSRLALGPTQRPVLWVLALFSRVQRPGCGGDHPPPAIAEVTERVELYLYAPSGHSRSIVGWTLPSPLQMLWKFLEMNSVTSYRQSIYTAKTKNKNNICIVNSVVRNQDLTPSKLTHDILHSYSFTFLYFNRLSWWWLNTWKYRVGHEK